MEGIKKNCYLKAIALNADIVVMIHPDYQYTPKLIRAMASLIADDVFDCVLGSRILGKRALVGGMPLYKYIANRALTFFQNIMLNYKLAEYHTGYRAFSREVLETLPLHLNSNDFIFDNQMLLQVLAYEFSIGEITCPTRYASESSTIGGFKAIQYGFGVVLESFLFRLGRLGLVKTKYYTS